MVDNKLSCSQSLGLLLQKRLQQPYGRLRSKRAGMWVVWMGYVGELQVHGAVSPFGVDFVGVAGDGWVADDLDVSLGDHGNI